VEEEGPHRALRRFLEKRGFWTVEYQRELEHRTRETIDQAVGRGKRRSGREAEIFLSVFEKRTPVRFGR
jgi:TPP-dependent pyruvate/acetoin dehydrogenase alpha subunit